MKLIELHILQSFPVSCLNRDEVGSPKSAVFGGVNRARISSQCLKRAIRQMARELQPDLFAGERTKLLIGPLQERLCGRGLGVDQAKELARGVGQYLAKLDEKAAGKGVDKVKTLMFLSPAELDAIAEALYARAGERTSSPTAAKKAKKGADGLDVAAAVRDACERVALKDAADVAIFGRMVASDHSLTVEGAGMFSHALTTHQADNELDFFSAVDDRRESDPTLSEDEEAGAGMIGTLEFTSGVFYRYAALNLDLLFFQSHDGKPTANMPGLADSAGAAVRRALVDAFVRATLMAVPGARRNSMNAHTLPSYVLGLFRESGHPVQLVNAFEKPVFSRSGLLDASVARMKAHHEEMKKTWGLKSVAEPAMPDLPLDAFVAELAQHVG